MPFDVSHDVNLSVTHWDGLKLSDNDAPDVLIVPSRLKQFSKVSLCDPCLAYSFISHLIDYTVHNRCKSLLPGERLICRCKCGRRWGRVGRAYKFRNSQDRWMRICFRVYWLIVFVPRCNPNTWPKMIAIR